MSDTTRNAPLADWCALCGDGYSPSLEISIADEPQDILGDEKYAWSHLQCERDHDRMFLEAFEETDGFADHFDGGESGDD